MSSRRPITRWRKLVRPHSHDVPSMRTMSLPGSERWASPPRQRRAASSPTARSRSPSVRASRIDRRPTHGRRRRSAWPAGAGIRRTGTVPRRRCPSPRSRSRRARAGCGRGSRDAAARLSTGDDVGQRVSRSAPRVSFSRGRLARYCAKEAVGQEISTRSSFSPRRRVRCPRARLGTSACQSAAARNACDPRRRDLRRMWSGRSSARGCRSRNRCACP